MLGSASCSLNITASLQERVTSLCVVKYGTEEGRVDLQKKALMLAGLLSECLMDCEDPFQELRCLRNAHVTPILSTSLHEDEMSVPYVAIDDMDKIIELGRSLARLYLDDQEDSARVLCGSVIEVMNGCAYLWNDDASHQQMMRFLFSATHIALSLEVIAHLFCDRVIDLKIAQENWSTSDALMAMSGLAGRYYAFASIDEEDRLLSEQDLQDEESSTAPHYDSALLAKKSTSMLNLISAEAMRMGVLDGSDLLKGIAANDIEYRAYPHLVYGLEPCYAVLADRYEIEGYGLKSLSVAKATGRMIAVACAGQDAEMEHHVARPLAVASFIGNFEHFSPA
jgi:hypothetical protein